MEKIIEPFDSFEHINAPKRLKSKVEKYGTYARFSYSKLRINLQPTIKFIKYFYTIDENQLPDKTRFNNFEIIGKIGNWFNKKNCYLIRCTCGVLSIKTRSMLSQHVSRGNTHCMYCNHQKSPYQIKVRVNNFTITKIIFGPPLTYNVICDCGHETNIGIQKIHKIKDRNTNWCEVCKEQIPLGEDITGKKFNNFTVIKYLGKTKIVPGKRKAVKCGDTFEYLNEYISKVSLWRVLCTNCNTYSDKEHKALTKHIHDNGTTCGVCKATNKIQVKIGFSKNGKTILERYEDNTILVGCNYCGTISRETNHTFFTKGRQGLGCKICVQENIRLEENTIDLTGNTYGNLKVLEKLGRNSDSRQSIWKVECIQCGETYEREYGSIMNSMKGNSIGCKKCKVIIDTKTSRFEDFTGTIAGIYKILGPGTKPVDSTEPDGCRFWEAECSKCGDIRHISTGRVTAAKRQNFENCKKCSERLPIGKKVGGYIITEFKGLDKNNRRLFEIKCSCGSSRVVDNYQLRTLEKSGKSCTECEQKQLRINLGYDD